MEKTILSADPRQVNAAMRTYLAEISMASQVLQRRLEEGRELEYLAVINRASARAAHLLDQLELARRLGDEDELRVNSATVDLVSWGREVTGPMAELLRTVGVELVFSTDLHTLITLADTALLEHMLLELVSNAVKAMPGGGTLRVTLQNTGKAAVLSVSDEGSGLSEEALERFFGENREPDLAPGAGAGLGLRLARAAAEAHGGLMMLDTAPGRGVRVAVSLPLREGRRERLRSPEVSLNARDRALRGLSEVLPEKLYGKRSK